MPAVGKVRQLRFFLCAQVAEEREREIRLRQMAMPRFETAEEQRECLKRDKQRQEFGEVAVNFTLVKPHPQYVYHTALPGESEEGAECDDVMGNSANGNCVHSSYKGDVMDKTKLHVTLNSSVAEAPGIVENSTKGVKEPAHNSEKWVKVNKTPWQNHKRKKQVVHVHVHVPA